MDAPDNNTQRKEPEGTVGGFLERSLARLSDEAAATADNKEVISDESSLVASGRQLEPRSSSFAGSITDMFLAASKNTVLSWWNQEEIECMVGCGNDQDAAQIQEGVPTTLAGGRSATHPMLELSNSRSYQSEAGIDCGLQSADSKKIRLGFALDQKLQEIKDKEADTKSSSSSTQCSSNSSEEGDVSNKDSGKQLSWKDRWANFVKRLGDAIAVFLTVLARGAAKNPYLSISFIVILSFVLIGVGCYTNFTLVLDNVELWPPSESFSVDQANWFYEESNFNYEYRYVNLLVHADGANVLSQEGVSRVFDAMSVIQDNSEYQEGCRAADLVGDANRVGECHIHSVSQFWNNSQSIFLEDVETNDHILTALTASRYPTGEGVDLARIVGNPYFYESEAIVYAESFLVEFDLPWSYETHDFEMEALGSLQALQDQWKAEDDNTYRLEIVAYRSYEDEFMRAIIMDLPLLPAVFAVMSLFCCVVFWRYDKVQSRSLLGIGAVVCIMLSIMTSHGLMFLLGIPFTTSTSMLPFLMFGIGLDDAFIILGSYSRTQGRDIVKRIEMTMKDVGLSIFITTLTSTLAFTLGCFSDIPAVRWLCIYAAPSVVIDFVYQITFFIALIVLDERRIQDGRMDCCTFVRVTNRGEEEEKDEEDGVMHEQQSSMIPPSLHEKHWADRFMGWYADKLLQPIVQSCVLVAYVTLLAGSIYATTQLTQYFDMNDMVPHDSYMRGYYSSLKDFGTTRSGLPSYAFYRDIDQSDVTVQKQMIQFLDELVDNDAISGPPSNFWLRDFLQYANETEMNSQSNFTFSEQVESFLQEPLYNDLYDDHIVRDDKTGEIISSRCEIYINVDVADAKGGIEALELLRAVSRAHAMNDGLDGKDWKFFTYQDMYNLWEFYSAVVSELSLSTIIGVVSVSLVGCFLIPHWTAVLFIAPMIVSLYIGMLGYISYANVYVNAISYVQLVMSIGLMVDFIIHILMRYYESDGTRREKVKHTLETMGSSVFVGGLSSLLGVSLLAFSTSQILNLVFVAVIGLVMLGIVHGLVFLPVILSLVGPQ